MGALVVEVGGVVGTPVGVGMGGFVEAGEGLLEVEEDEGPVGEWCWPVVDVRVSPREGQQFASFVLSSQGSSVGCGRRVGTSTQGCAR